MKTETRSALLTKLFELQGTSSDSEMSEQFGVTRSYWSMLRHGRREMSLNMIRRAIELYPELAAYHLRDMQSGRD